MAMETFKMLIKAYSDAYLSGKNFGNSAFAISPEIFSCVLP